jgi:hypothetical protein
MCLPINAKNWSVTQKEGNTQKTPIGNRLTSLDSITYTPSHELPAISLTCYNSRITMQNHTMQLPITQMVRLNLMSHNTKTIRPVASDWTSTMHLHIQTSRTDIIRLHKSTSCLYFTESTTTAQASRPLPSSNLFNYS